jgi:hypothetical protein
MGNVGWGMGVDVPVAVGAGVTECVGNGVAVAVGGGDVGVGSTRVCGGVVSMTGVGRTSA